MFSDDERPRHYFILHDDGRTDGRAQSIGRRQIKRSAEAVLQSPILHYTPSPLIVLRYLRVRSHHIYIRIYYISIWPTMKVFKNPYDGFTHTNTDYCIFL